jgi:anthranilate phosphoribosyltransferase
MKAVIGPRKELGMRTVFNVLGPLTNPAGADAQVVGVYDPDLVPVLARALAHMDVDRALVVHGDGMDEICLHGETVVAEVDGDDIEEYVLTPARTPARPSTSPARPTPSPTVSTPPASPSRAAARPRNWTNSGTSRRRPEWLG